METEDYTTARIGGGLKPRKYLDHRNFDYHRTFGSITSFVDSLDLDAGLTMPNQNVPDSTWGNPPYPNGCTAFTTTDVATDEDKAIYDPGFTYKQTLLIEGSPMGSGCTVQDSMKSATVYGLRATGELPDQALQHRRGPYFEIRPTDGMDWFDSARSALQMNRRSVSVGTQWFPSITYAYGGVVNDVVLVPTTDWHNYKACGFRNINDIQYIKVKPWVGDKLGDAGFYWFGRIAFNKLMSVDGTGAFTNAHAMPGDILTVKLTIAQTLLSYYYRLLSLLNT